MKRGTKNLTALAGLGAVLLAGAGVFVYSGAYNVGADDHHTRPVFALMEAVRERSIRVRSKNITVPDLEDPQLVLKGAGQYAAMCTGCHLQPGMKDSELRPGLYPQPPNLSQVRVDPKEAFWVIKHGLKMSAMPAWGTTHDDDTIWSMVAFLQKLPELSSVQYEDMVSKAPPDEDMEMGAEGGGENRSHGSMNADTKGKPPMKGMPMAGGEADTKGKAPMNGMPVAGGDAPGDDHGRADASPEAVISLEGLKRNAVPGAEGVAQAFHAALQNGDRPAALALLAPEITVSEDGHTQSLESYASGHLAEDMAFLKGAKIVPLSLGSILLGKTARVGSEAKITTIRKGQPTTLRSREMLTLKKEGSDWKIVEIQWQSFTTQE